MIPGEWRVDVNFAASTQHLFFDDEQAARNAHREIVSALKEYKEFGLNRGSRETVSILDNTSETEIVIRMVSSCRLMDSRAWRELVETRLDVEAMERAKSEHALEAARQRIKSENNV